MVMVVLSRIPYFAMGVLAQRKFAEGCTSMRVFSAVIEKCAKTGLFVGFVLGFAGAHSQAETLDELNRNLKEVISMLLEDGDPLLDSEFVGIQNVAIA